MQVLLHRWRLSFSHVIAFGDDHNDTEIIRSSYLGIAMGNAVPELKAIAQYIAPSNEEDGVAHVLENLLLDKFPPLR